MHSTLSKSISKYHLGKSFCRSFFIWSLQKILYFLGGVDTWLNPKYAIMIFQWHPIKIMVCKHPLRICEACHKTSEMEITYLLLNSELRVPIFSLIAKKPLKSAFLQDFQLVGFFDAGFAYNLANPFNKDNSLSKEVVNDPIRQPIVVTVNYYRNPFVFGAGAGVRTNILRLFL
jgi:hypothetical protein